VLQQLLAHVQVVNGQQHLVRREVLKVRGFV
jgi:hypothetical protein